MPGRVRADPGALGSAWAYYGQSMIHWVPEPERPRWLQVMELLRQRILDGAYQPRTKIPSFKQLVQEFGVGMNTVRHAVEDLEDQGYLRAVQPLGTFVTPREEWPAE